MRLDHLLSKESGRHDVQATTMSGTKSFVRVNQYCLILKALGFQIQRRSDHPKLWGCSAAGSAPALQAGGQEFDPPHLHQHGLIAQVVRARA